MMNPKEVHDKLEALEARMRQLSSTNKQLIDALIVSRKQIIGVCEHNERLNNGLKSVADRQDLEQVETALRDAGVNEEE